MDIHLAGSRPTRRAPKEYFTGTVLQDPIIATEAPARLVCDPRLLRAGRADGLAFPSAGPDAVRHLGRRPGAEPRAGRSAKSGPAMWSGSRRAKSIGMARSPTNGMTHIAMQEALDGSYATWMEQVTDAEYSAKVGD